ncbi:Ubiquitin carboxyl-terminal hydrolase isozyme L3, partial [Podila verticillata]
LDEELLAFVPQPAHALILLFPITPKYETYVQQEKERIDKQGQTVSPNIVFYPQTIANACGTMGVLHSIANNWAHGGHLKLAVAIDQSLANVHESHASTGQTATPDLADEVNLHYVCLVERDGHLYELDGNKPYPINHGISSKDTFLTDAVKVAKEFVGRDPENLNFSVIAATTAEEYDD